MNKISVNDLFVSEPDPSWFGNGPNEPDHPCWTNKNWLKSRFHFSLLNGMEEETGSVV